MGKKPKRQRVQVRDNTQDDAQLGNCDNHQNMQSNRQTEDHEGAPSADFSSQVLFDSYNKLYEKYTQLKARTFEETYRILEEQKKKHLDYHRDSEALIEGLKKEICSLHGQLNEFQSGETQKRLKKLEKENILLQNELLMAQAKELTSELKGNSLSVKVLQSLTQLQPIPQQKPSELVLLHQATGLEFKLEEIQDAEFSKQSGGEVVRLTIISLGTLSGVAPSWMHDECITFGMIQMDTFLKRVLRVANGLCGELFLGDM